MTNDDCQILKYVLHVLVQELSRWVTGSEELFYKIPLPGFPRLQTCPACSGSVIQPIKMSSVHVFEECSVIESARSRLGIRTFITAYEANVQNDVSTLSAFLNGLDEYGVQLNGPDHRDRGASLINLRDVWRSTWCHKSTGEKRRHLNYGIDNCAH